MCLCCLVITLSTLQGKLCACELPVKEKKLMPTIFKQKLSKICWFLVLECEHLLMFFVIFMMADEKFLVLGLLAGHNQFEDFMSGSRNQHFSQLLSFTRLND